MEDLDGLEMRHLRYFLAVARSGQISAASRELNIAQPSLSQLIQRLERRIGIPLFERTARGVELTPGGEAFRRWVETMSRDLESVLAEATSAATVVRIGVCAGVFPALLGQIENEIIGARETAVFRSANSSRQLELLRSGELDFGIVRLPIIDDDMTVATVCDQELGVVTHITHPLSSRAELAWADLAGQRLLWFDARRAPGYAKGLLAELAACGWSPRLHTLDSDRRALFTHTLGSGADLVALRPAADVADDPQLVWHGIAGGKAPRERLALIALHGRHAESVRRLG